MPQVKDLSKGDVIRKESGPFTHIGVVQSDWRAEGDGVTVLITPDSPLATVDEPMRISFAGIDTEVEVIPADDVTAYEVISKQGSASMGAYEGDTPAEALATYVRDAGYSAEVVNEETVKTDDPAPCGGYELQGDDESYHHLKVRQ